MRTAKERKYFAILDRAMSLTSSGKTETFLDLVKWLNKNKFRNNAGQPYSASRGAAKVVASASHYFSLNFGKRKAAPIAKAFTTADG